MTDPARCARDIARPRWQRDRIAPRGDPATSYVAALFAKGDDAILKKIGEEATETVMAAKDGDKLRLTAEVADLWFHCLVLLARHGLGPADVLAELARREGTSGIAEKAAREALSRPSSTIATGGADHTDDGTVPDCVFCKIVRGRDPEPRRSTRTTTCSRSTTSIRWRRCTSC